tara:strand:- start:94 stop:438 length:345 start_codon:yes stop_codon:yes gene_type:complete
MSVAKKAFHPPPKQCDEGKKPAPCCGRIIQTEFIKNCKDCAYGYHFPDRLIRCDVCYVHKCFSCIEEEHDDVAVCKACFNSTDHCYEEVFRKFDEYADKIRDLQRLLDDHNIDY